VRTAHLLHGFNVADGGAGSIDRLKPYLEAGGYRVRDHDYGHFLFRQVRFENGAVAEKVAAAVKKGDVGVGHSNGCAILMRAAALGAPFRGLVFINPALDEDCVAADHVRFVHVYFNDGDYAVWFSRLLRFNHPWGAMGRVGFKGTDPRYVNIDCAPDVQGHSDIFTKLEKWGPAIIGGVKAALRR
jgi:pimeloyl-ACP methyl ester carboxylesterase